MARKITDAKRDEDGIFVPEENQARIFPIGTKVSKEEKEEIEWAAKEAGMSTSKFVLEAVREKMERMNQHPLD